VVAVTEVPALATEIHRNDGRYFDCAFLARVPESVVEATVRHKPRPWKDIVDGARQSIATTLAPLDGDAYSFDPDEYVSLFTNTTSAFKRLLAQIERNYAGSHPSLLTTDLEYPGCVAAIDDSWRGPVIMAQLSTGLMSHLPDADEYLNDALIRSFNFVKPRVVLVSHVMRATGQVLSQETLRCFREANPCVVIIVDGSQATGNVLVDERLLHQCDFYISSGHKWLGGMTTSGFVWHREPERWHVADPAQSVSYRGQRQLGGSGNAAAWISLADSIVDMVGKAPMTRLSEIAAHNRALGALFRQRLSDLSEALGCVTPFPGGEPPSGLVTVSVAKPAGETLEAALREQGFAFSVLEHEQIRWRERLEERFLLERGAAAPAVKPVKEYTAVWPRRTRTEFRFCFHYWHNEDDVAALTDAIYDHVGTYI
jgi:selenocysteine lyase/cysteine desulfurase